MRRHLQRLRTRSRWGLRNGWLSGIEARPSPHRDCRPRGERVTLAVIHYVSLPAGCFRGDTVDRLFMGTLDEEICARLDLKGLLGLRVSTHFFIRRNGRILQYVDVNARAWHAGLSNFRGRNAANDFSLGIELEGTGEVPFEGKQYAALTKLLKRLARRFPVREVTGHEFIAPGRKTDPGPYFDWKRLAKHLPRGVEVAIAPNDCDRAMFSRRMAELAH